MICDLGDMSAFLCFLSRWWGWENWLSRLRTASSALSARHPSSLRLSSHWRRTIMLASCKQLKISLKGKGDVPLNERKNLTLRQLCCHSCCIVLSQQRPGQRQGASWHIPPKYYFVPYQGGKNLAVMLNQNIPLRRGAVRKECKLELQQQHAQVKDLEWLPSRCLMLNTLKKRVYGWNSYFMRNSETEKEIRQVSTLLRRNWELS